MKQYVTFGQVHIHSINGKTLDKDCVAVYEADDAEAGRDKAFEIFGPKFSFHYTEKNFDHEWMKWYPRGFIEV